RNTALIGSDQRTEADMPTRKPKVRTGQLEVALDRAEFARRFRAHFFDPRFDPLAEQIEVLTEVAWRNYQDSRKSPRTVPAGKEFADPTYEVSVEWLDTRKRIRAAAEKRKRRAQRGRVLIVNGSARNDKTCPGEMSKTHRLVQLAREELRRLGRIDVDVLDLSRLTAEYGRVIYPCKACVSTAMPLCHWPCS